MRIMRWTGLVCCMVTLICGCASPRWDGLVESWGGMRQVMREGQTESRVSMPQVLAKPHAFGVGAVEGLQGEIVIDDGRCWIGDVVAEVGGSVLRVREDQQSPRATLLVVAYVPAWSDKTIERALASDEIETYVREAAQRAGIDATQPFPFVIEGEFRDLAAHVINGYCPMNEHPDGASAVNQPIRLERESVHGKLIGIYAENSAGELTHHGSSMHVHVLTDSPRAVAHVERVALAPSARLRMPAR
jgi:alpha-acetolactate decarboxylase